MTDDLQPYNDFAQFPYISGSMIEYMLNNNEMIWKLLFYDDANAYKNDTSHPNLSISQKRSLIYDGDKPITSCRVFQDVGQDWTWTDQVCTLRISPVELIPVHNVIGNVVIAIEIYSHYQINTLSNHITRTNAIAHEIIRLFNGRSVGGIGKLYFDSRANPKCKMIAGGTIPFKANVIQMCNWVV